MKKIFKSVLLFTSLIAMTGCKNDSSLTDKSSSSSAESTSESSIPGETTNYTLTFKNAADSIIKNLEVSLTRDGNTVASGTTNSRGRVTFKDIEAYDYSISLGELPAGYDEEQGLVFDKTQKAQTFTLDKGTLRQASEYKTSTSYSLGSVLCDFTVECVSYDTDGETILTTNVTLSDLLDTHDCVLLNFWATWCGPCKNEIPHLNQLYKDYGDKIGFISLNADGYGEDTASKVAAFRKEYEIEFNTTAYSAASINLANSFSVTGIPTNIIISKKGFVKKISSGAFSTYDSLKTFFSDYIS